MLTLTIVPNLEDIILQTPQGEVVLRFTWERRGRMQVHIRAPAWCHIHREKIKQAS